MYATEILTKVFALKEMLINSSEYKLVKEKEEEMEEKCSFLLLEYNRLFEEYNEALRFEKYGGDVNGSRVKLHEVKKLLDDNHYVKKYRNAYKNIDKLLKELEEIIFKGIIDKKYLNI